MPSKAEKAPSGTTSVKLGQHRKETLSQLAQRKKRSVHSLVLEAVDVYIKNQQAWADFEDQAVRSYEQMQTTGMHVTLDEMRTWAKELKTNPNAPLPIVKRDILSYAGVGKGLWGNTPDEIENSLQSIRDR